MNFSIQQYLITSTNNLLMYYLKIKMRQIFCFKVYGTKLHKKASSLEAYNAVVVIWNNISLVVLYTVYTFCTCQLYFGTGGQLKLSWA